MPVRQSCYVTAGLERLLDCLVRYGPYRLNFLSVGMLMFAKKRSVLLVSELCSFSFHFQNALECKLYVGCILKIAIAEAYLVDVSARLDIIIWILRRLLRCFMAELVSGIDVDAVEQAHKELTQDILQSKHRLFNLVESLDPLEIMLRTAWYSRFMAIKRAMGLDVEENCDPFEELAYNNANLIPEFLQSSLLFVAANGKPSQSDDSASNRLEEMIACAESIIDTLNRSFLIRYSHAYIIGKKSGLSEDVANYLVEAVGYLPIRGKRYQVIEEAYLTLLLSKQDELIQSVYGVGFTEIIYGFTALMRSLTLGWPDAMQSLVEQYESWEEKGDSAFEEVSKKQAAAITESVFGCRLHDVSSVTNWPETLIDDLSLPLASASDFDSFASIDPLGIMPIVNKPFLEIEGRSYCFCAANFLDNFYRSFYRAIRNRFVSEGLGSNNDFVLSWKDQQALASEEGVAELFKKLLPGSKICVNGYHPTKGTAWNKHSFQESDLVVLFDDVLIAVEVKAGAFCPTDPLDDAEGHIKSFTALLGKASKQAQSTIDYVHRCYERTCRFYDSNGNVKFEISPSGIRADYKICVTVDDINEFASKADKLGFIKIANSTIALSIDDLIIYNEYFDNPLVFLHFLEQRRSAASMPALYMNDELDHLGMYIDNNCYTKTLEREAKESGVDYEDDSGVRFQGFFGFRDSIDAWFEGLYTGKVCPKPVQDSPHIFNQIIAMLDNKELGYWRRAVASTFLNCGSDVRKAVSGGITARLKPSVPADLRLELPPQDSADVPLSIFVSREERPNDDGVCRSKCLAALLYDERSFVIRLDLHSAKGRIISLKISEYRAEGLTEKDKASALQFIPSLTKTRNYCIQKQLGRKIGRNEPCPCGSGKKYKKCCGRRSV